MKAVLDLLRIREAGRRNLRRARVEIAGDGLYPLAYGSRIPVQGLANNLGLLPLTIATRATCLPWRALFIMTA